MIDRYDFDVVSVYCDAPFHPSYAALLLMAPHLHRARLGAAAIPPARVHPIDIAAQTALLAQIAPGGVYVGLARGAWLADHGIARAGQADSGDPRSGGRRALPARRQNGRLSRAKSIRSRRTSARPIRCPTEPIPLLIGTWGRRLCALAGEIADEVKVGGSANPDLIPVIRGYIAEGERKAGRDGRGRHLSGRGHGDRRGSRAGARSGAAGSGALSAGRRAA